MVATPTAIPAASTAIPPNAAAVPTTDAIPPTTGPNSAPPIAAASAEPISSPRRSAGAISVSHVSAAVHVKELDTPCANRAVSSSHSLCASPNRTVVAISPPSPISAARLTPSREVAIPPGSAPTNVPSG